MQNAREAGLEWKGGASFFRATKFLLSRVSSRGGGGYPLAALGSVCVCQSAPVRALVMPVSYLPMNPIAKFEDSGEVASQGGVARAHDGSRRAAVQGGWAWQPTMANARRAPARLFFDARYRTGGPHS